MTLNLPVDITGHNKRVFRMIEGLEQLSEKERLGLFSLQKGTVTKKLVQEELMEGEKRK